MSMQSATLPNENPRLSWRGHPRDIFVEVGKVQQVFDPHSHAETKQRAQLEQVIPDSPGKSKSEKKKKNRNPGE